MMRLEQNLKVKKSDEEFEIRGRIGTIIKYSIIGKGQNSQKRPGNLNKLAVS